MSLEHTYVTAPHSSNTFSEVGSLQTSVEAFERYKEQDPAILERLPKLVVDHKKNDVFCMSLLHKHFPISENQILVELDNVTTPRKVSSTDVAQLCTKGFPLYEDLSKDGRIYPTSRAVTINEPLRLTPYEFAFKLLEQG